MQFSGSGNIFTKWECPGDPCLLGGLVLFSTKITGSLCSSGGDAIQFSGAAKLFEGIVYAPNGRIKISGSQNGSQYIGMLNALAADVAGSGFTLQAQLTCPNRGVFSNYIVH